MNKTISEANAVLTAEPIPQKIAFLLPSLKFGGAERVALNLAKALKDTGIQVDILLMSKEGEFLAEAEKHFKVVNLRCNKTYKLPGKLLVYMIKYRPYALISSFWKLNLCACWVRMAFPVFRLLLWEHSLPSHSANHSIWLYSITSSIFYQFATKIIVVSKGVYHDIHNVTLGLRRLMVVIYNAITPPRPEYLDMCAESNHYGAVIITVGRLEPVKNQALILEAFALLPEHLRATLIIVGDGSLRGDLENLSQQVGISERVTFLGYHPNPYQFLVNADLFVVSSNHEGLGNVIIEALYCGLPVVSTDCGEGVREILLDGQYGTIVPPGDKFALAKGMQTVLKTQHSEQDQKKGARRFLPSIIAQKFLASM